MEGVDIDIRGMLMEEKQEEWTAFKQVSKINGE
jgi:hypothetical protein